MHPALCDAHHIASSSLSLSHAAALRAHYAHLGPGAWGVDGPDDGGARVWPYPQWAKERVEIGPGGKCPLFTALRNGSAGYRMPKPPGDAFPEG